MSHRIIFFGSSSFGLPSLEAILTMPEVEIATIVSQPAKPVGRKAMPTQTPVANWAEAHAFPRLTPPSLRSSEVVTTLKNIQADTYIVAAYGLILPPVILDIPEFHCINIHGSLLPKYRGASPIAAAILNGETKTGISFMLMDAGIDTGPVLEQHDLTIASNETTPQLEDRLGQLAADNLAGMLNQWWDKKMQPQPQFGPSSYAAMLKTYDGQADWSSAVALERKIRAFQPWPGVWTTWRGQRVKILSASVSDEKSNKKPGAIVPRSNHSDWAVVCPDGLLIPDRVQMAGKKSVAASTLPGSYPDFFGSHFD